MHFQVTHSFRPYNIYHLALVIEYEVYTTLLTLQPFMVSQSGCWEVFQTFIEMQLSQELVSQFL